MLLKEEADDFLRVYDTYCRRTEDGWAAGVECKLHKMSELLSYSQQGAIIFLYFGGRGLTEEMLTEGVTKIAGVADWDADLDLEQPERDITRKLKLLPDLRVCEQVFAVERKVQELLQDQKLSAVFVPNAR